MSPRKTDKGYEIAKMVLQYARISILTFLLLKILTSKDKEAFIRQIDASLLDQERSKELEARVQGLRNLVSVQ